MKTAKDIVGYDRDGSPISRGAAAKRLSCPDPRFPGTGAMTTVNLRSNYLPVWEPNSHQWLTQQKLSRMRASGQLSPMAESCVYFAQLDDPQGDLPAGSIKIGVTTRLAARMKELSRPATGMPGVDYKFSLLGTRPGGQPDERALHARFASQRISPRAEWFRPSPELLVEANRQ